MLNICDRSNLRTQQSIELPPQGQYATGLLFLHPETYKQAKESFNDLAKGCGTRVIAWRNPSTDSSVLGSEARKTEPYIRQVCERVMCILDTCVSISGVCCFKYANIGDWRSI